MITTSGRDAGDEELLDLPVKYPDLLQRPIAEKGGRDILGGLPGGYANYSEICGTDPVPA